MNSGIESVIGRRQVLQGAMALGAGMAFSGQTQAAETIDKAATNGRINHSVAFWCFNIAGDKWDVAKTCQITRDLGGKSVELLGPENWPTLREYGLVCAMAPNGMPGMPFVKGWNNPNHHEELTTRTKAVIDACVENKFPNVIAFVGMKWRNAEDPQSGEIPNDEAAANCVDGLKKIASYAEQKGINVCVEHLNTRDDTHPMKGHPGYQGDDLDFVASIIRNVGSPRVKLLFDIYHVQIMHGDVIRRLEQNKDIIAHIHTAGNPGRCELDEKQEIFFPPIIQKLVDIGYTGYVGHEFIPTRDPLAGLTQAVKVCDV